MRTSVKVIRTLARTAAAGEDGMTLYPLIGEHGPEGWSISYLFIV